MIFKLKIEAKENKITFKNNSAVVKFFSDDNGLSVNLKSYTDKNNIKLNSVLRDEFVKGDKKKIKVRLADGKPDIFYLVKIKVDEKLNTDYFRNYFAGLIKNLKTEKIKFVHVDVPVYDDFKNIFKDEKYFYQTFAEGFYLGNYTFEKYKSDNKKPESLFVFLHSKNFKKVSFAIHTADKLINAVSFTKDLVNEPANKLTPAEFANRAKKELQNLGIKVTVFNKSELIKRKMGAVLAVGDGSKNEPKMIILNYKPKTKAKKKIALVGKGVTYDTGGLSIKSTAGMLEMKADMAGGAVVAGIIKSAADLKLPVELIGIIPAVENSISGNSFRPGDIIKTSSGKSIEVMDTDAEGRIILSDALEYASNQKPDEIIEFSTLTGAIAVALGLFTSGLFTKSDELSEKLLESAYNTYERIWRMPMWDDFNEEIKSDIADVKNLGSRWGGAITAAKFLEKFVNEKIPFAHLDIAGPSLHHKLTNYTDKFHTGYGVRLIFDYLTKIN